MSSRERLNAVLKMHAEIDPMQKKRRADVATPNAIVTRGAVKFVWETVVHCANSGKHTQARPFNGADHQSMRKS